MNGEGFARLASHVYWHRKKQFALERDSYPYWTLFAAEEGRFSFAIGPNEGEAGFGDLVLCPPGTSFYRKTLETLSFHFLQFHWESGADNGKTPLWAGKLSVSDTERLSSDFAYLRRLPAYGKDDGAVRSCEEHLLNDLWRMAVMEQVVQINAGLTPTVDSHFQHARDYLLANAYSALSMRNLADAIGLTPVQLTRGFQSAYGMTPTEFVTGLRLDRACRLLEETALSIDRIAHMCGYENGFYLSRLFSRKKGISPSIYRQNRRV
ncbi:AraC family transcriptional regulator [Paenibacillus spongiae]|uniref:AraC family transcriptional regulator n=1 Tax=Paenibacillus spongiae TaxID=2909671 RepID=A0ABY5S6C4_9BACL|nr:AraC family transcriptional regulator [Paenibacillus spongiae]UVI29135.1 AraC family transcriptional regulator [Paenibacillus spongiae]